MLGKRELCQQLSGSWEKGATDPPTRDRYMMHLQEVSMATEGSYIEKQPCCIFVLLEVEPVSEESVCTCTCSNNTCVMTHL